MKSQAAVLRGVGKDSEQAERLPDDHRSTPRGHGRVYEPEQGAVARAIKTTHELDDEYSRRPWSTCLRVPFVISIPGELRNSIRGPNPSSRGRKLVDVVVDP